MGLGKIGFSAEPMFAVLQVYKLDLASIYRLVYKLDLRFFGELMVSPKTVVGCKGESRYVEGAGNCLNSKHKSYQTSISCFDRYEIHIQYF